MAGLFKLLLALTILSPSFVSLQADADWSFEGPVSNADGSQSCRVISPNGFGLEMTNGDGYSMAFFNLSDTKYPILQGFSKKETMWAVIQADLDYGYWTEFYKFSSRTASDGKTLYTIGFSGADFHLLKAMKKARFLHIKFTGEASRLFTLKSNDVDMSFSLSGSSPAIEKAMKCS